MDTHKVSSFKLIPQNKKNVHLLTLLAILLLATILRFTALNSLPVSPYWDEVSEGYNSYSLFLTGKDEYGAHLPLFFRGFDDDKLPVYIYSSIIPIAIFGLN